MKELLLFAENLISGMFPFALLMICGAYLTLKGRFFQFSRFPQSVRLVKKAYKTKKNTSCGISSLQSACTALSATVGTGNIAGVAGAVSLGGAGAVFWMWISALVGMAIKFGEISLAIHFREKNGGRYIGGPMYYIKNGLPKALRPLGYIFALAGIPAVLCSGNITQTNAAVSSLGGGLCTKLTSGIAFALLTALVIKGGAKRIGAVTEKIIPVMSVLYTLLALGVIILNIDFLPSAFKMIIKGAFSPKAVTGGAVGSAMTAVMTGASRGIFSNEAGLGTSAMAHSEAYDADESIQGLFGIFEVFIDTILICTLTALTILCSGVNIEYGSIASSELVAGALSVCFGKASSVILAVMMCIFAFSSVIGWALYGDVCISYLFGGRLKKLFSALYPAACLLGALFDVSAAWRLSSFFNGIMLCTNLPAILLLSDNFLKIEGKRIDKGKNRKASADFK